MYYVGQLFGDTLWGGYLELSLRIFAAGICGVIIGGERSKRRKEAGIRTHFIVCIAAALMMIVSKYGFGDLVASNGQFLLGTDGTDPARIAAQVISGISFLGAGIIFHNKSSVRGLTTAAGIWATAGIGLALGAGMYYIGILATAVIGIMQLALHRSKLLGDAFSTYQITFTVVDNPKVRKTVETYFNPFKSQMIESKLKFEDATLLTYSYTIRTDSTFHLEEFEKMLSECSEVKAISIGISNS